MKKLLVAIVAVLALFTLRMPLFAEDNNISGTAPTTNVDGSPLTDLAEIKIYHSVNGGGYELLTVLPFTEPGGEFNYLHARQGDGRHCYAATAVRAGGQESDFSDEACKVIDTLLPSAPSGLAVR